MVKPVAGMDRTPPIPEIIRIESSLYRRVVVGVLLPWFDEPFCGFTGGRPLLQTPSTYPEKVPRSLPSYLHYRTMMMMMMMIWEVLTHITMTLFTLVSLFGPPQDQEGNPLQTEYGMCIYKDHQSITIQVSNGLAGS